MRQKPLSSSRPLSSRPPLTKRLKPQKQIPLHKLVVKMEAKEVFALAMEGVGGLQGMIDWIKESTDNRAAFYANYAKLLNLPPMVTVNNNTVNVETERVEGEQLRQSMVDAMARIVQARRQDFARSGLIQVCGITYRKLEDGSLVPTDEVPSSYGAATITDNTTGVTINAETGVVIRNVGPPPDDEPEVQRAVERDSCVIIDGKRAEAEVIPPQSPASPMPPRVVKQTGPSVPGICAGAVFEGEGDNRSTTQKFLDWNGHRRPPGQ